MQAPSDISLVKRVAEEHDRQAFDLLVRRYQSPVRKFLLSLTLGSEALSDDLAQDTFLKAYLNMGKFRAEAAFSTWLMRIAYRVFYDHKRKTSASELSDGAEDFSASESTVFSAPSGESETMRIDIYHALSLLREEERTCVTLQLIQGESIDHIAEVTGMAINTVKSHLHRGKERLANYLKQNGYDR